MPGEKEFALGTENINLVAGGQGSGSTKTDMSKAMELPVALSSVYKNGRVIASTAANYTFPTTDSYMGIPAMFGGARSGAVE